MGIRSLLRNAFGRSKATREETGAAPSGADKPESATIPEAREESVPAATAPAPEAEVPAARTAPTETPDTDPAPAPTTATLPAQGGRADRGDRPAETSPVREDEAAAEAPATAEPSPVDAAAVEPSTAAEPSVAEETAVAGKSEADAVEDKASAATGNDKDVPADEAPEATDAAAPAASDTVSDLVSQAFDNPSQAPAADAEPTADADADEPTTDAAAAEPTADAAEPEPERAAEPVAEVKETAEAEPVAEADETPAAEPVATADAVAEPEPEPTVEPAAEVVAEPADAVVAEAADAAAVEAEAEAAAEPEAAPEPVTEAAAKTEAAEAEPKSEPKAEPKPKAKSGAKPEATAATAEKAADRPGAETPGALPTVAPALLSLYKSAGATLDKHGLATQRAAVYLVLDRSGSMRNYYKDGTVQNLAEQALGLAAHFDDDATVPVVFFSTDIDGTADIDLTNYEGRIAELHAGLGHMGRTNYHWAINAVVDHYKKSGSTAPAFVIFQTDGAPTSKPAAEKALCEAAGLPIFWQFIGFGDPDAKGFDFLRKLDDLAVPEKRVIDNAGFFHAGRDPRGLSHDELYQQLMVEFPEWLAEARTAGVIKDN
ncbi:VWA domain-containing protein [Streptomyces caniferus]|uniref:VWA domain-containing protein n=1 Tax=Streptomyces caniferus TaxID=285557 RepID=A0ABZ1VLQ0_9ACTN|nr:VWA domain-containing protein [Streptomyces caniferus]